MKDNVYSISCNFDVRKTDHLAKGTVEDEKSKQFDANETGEMIYDTEVLNDLK